MSKKLQVEPGKTPPPHLRSALAHFPHRILQLAHEAAGPGVEPTRRAIAAIADRDPAQVGRWLKYEGLEGLEVELFIRLEEHYGLIPGTLLLPSPREIRPTDRLLGDSRISAGDTDMMTVVLPAALQMAARALIEYTGRAPRDVCNAALELLDKHGIGPSDRDVDFWFPKLKEHVHKTSESGEYDSVSSVLAAAPIGDQQADSRR